MHPGSKDTFDIISAWEPGPIPMSKNNQFGRMGIVSILAYIAVQSSPGGILEIGCGESSVFLGEIAKRFDRKAYFIDLQRSVIYNAMTVPGYFGSKDNYVEAISSDEFFKLITLPPLAFAFIDGGHLYEQVRKDFFNILPYIEETGLIALHDTYPPDEEFIGENRCGTVYKLRQELEAMSGLDVFTFIRGAMDVGLTIVRKKPKERPEYKR